MTIRLQAMLIMLMVGDMKKSLMVSVSIMSGTVANKSLQMLLTISSMKLTAISGVLTLLLSTTTETETSPSILTIHRMLMVMLLSPILTMLSALKRTSMRMI